MKTILRNATLAAAILGSVGIAAASSIPGMRGHDHTGITVPDMKQAVDFFTEVVGCKKAMSFGPFADDKGTFMQDVLGVDPKAVIEQITMVRCGTGSNIELFKYTAPDQKDLTPRNSDIGGFHIAFYVDDVAAAKAYLDAKGVKTRMGTIAGQGRAGRRPDHPLLPGAMGAAAGSDQLSLGHGLREGCRDRFVEPEEPGKVMGKCACGCSAGPPHQCDVESFQYETLSLK